METPSIKRLYYSISEVSHLVDEEQYVLRYWETEFEQLRPQKNRAGNRIYTDKDLELVRTIKHLLREKRFTIDGAKEYLKQSTKTALSGSVGDSANDAQYHSSTSNDTPHHRSEDAQTEPDAAIEAAEATTLPKPLSPIVAALPESASNGVHVSEDSILEAVSSNELLLQSIPVLPQQQEGSESHRALSREELVEIRNTLRAVLTLLESAGRSHNDPS